MKKLFYTILGLILLSNVNAQTPISSLDMLSLSDGRYDELHEYSRYERIGPALIDMETMKIVSFINRDSLQKIGEIEQSMTTRFLTIDPLARKYPEMNPYGYCANNPINAFDPDGREIVYLVRNNDGVVTNKYRYQKGNFYNTSTNKVYNVEKGNNSTLTRLAKSYSKIENSNDDVLKGRLHKIENSQKMHYVEEGEDSGVRPMGGGHTQTTYNFKDENDGDYEDIGRSDVGTTAHEMQHQYDWDTNNMGDNDDASATDPAEIRAVATENKARDIENKEHRTTYHREKIDPEELINPPNYK